MHVVAGAARTTEGLEAAQGRDKRLEGDRCGPKAHSRLLERSYQRRDERRRPAETMYSHRGLASWARPNGAAPMDAVVAANPQSFIHRGLAEA
jgi:hypothetical protein